MIDYLFQNRFFFFIPLDSNSWSPLVPLPSCFVQQPTSLTFHQLWSSINVTYHNECVSFVPSRVKYGAGLLIVGNGLLYRQVHYNYDN